MRCGKSLHHTANSQCCPLRLRFESGASGLIHVSGVARVSRSIIEAHGSEASLVIDQNRLSAGRDAGGLQAVEVPPRVRGSGLTPHQRQTSAGAY